MSFSKEHREETAKNSGSRHFPDVNEIWVELATFGKKVWVIEEVRRVSAPSLKRGCTVEVILALVGDRNIKRNVKTTTLFNSYKRLDSFNSLRRELNLPEICLDT